MNLPRLYSASWYKYIGYREGRPFFRRGCIGWSPSGEGVCLEGSQVSASGGLLTSAETSAACAEANCPCQTPAIPYVPMLSAIYAIQKKSRIINIERDFCKYVVSWAELGCQRWNVAMATKWGVCSCARLSLPSLYMFDWCDNKKSLYLKEIR